MVLDNGENVGDNNPDDNNNVGDNVGVVFEACFNLAEIYMRCKQNTPLNIGFNKFWKVQK